STLPSPQAWGEEEMSMTEPKTTEAAVEANLNEEAVTASATIEIEELPIPDLALMQQCSAATTMVVGARETPRHRVKRGAPTIQWRQSFALCSSVLAAKPSGRRASREMDRAPPFAPTQGHARERSQRYTLCGFRWHC